MSDSISTLYDLDLFFQCGEFTSHCATAGGFVPDNIIMNPRHAQIRASLLTDESLEFKYRINPALDKILAIKYDNQGVNESSFDRNSYVQDFIFFAKKGCFSFDRTYIIDPFRSEYHLVAYPIFNNMKSSALPQDLIDHIIRFDFDKPMRLFY